MIACVGRCRCAIMHKHFVDVLDATVDSTPGMAIMKSPMISGREGATTASGESCGHGGSVREGCGRRGRQIGRGKQRFDTDRPIARGSAGDAVLMKRAACRLCVELGPVEQRIKLNPTNVQTCARRTERFVSLRLLKMGNRTEKPLTSV